MKVIENNKRAIENSGETLLNEVFALQVRIEVPPGASLDHPRKTASYIMSQVARTAPRIKSILTADAGLAAVTETIKNGVLEPKQHPGAMPPMGGVELSDEHLKAAAAYVWSLGHKGKKK